MIDAQYIASALLSGAQTPERLRKAKNLAQKYAVPWASVEAGLSISTGKKARAVPVMRTARRTLGRS